MGTKEMIASHLDACLACFGDVAHVLVVDQADTFGRFHVGVGNVGTGHGLPVDGVLVVRNVDTLFPPHFTVGRGGYFFLRRQVGMKRCKDNLRIGFGSTNHGSTFLLHLFPSIGLYATTRTEYEKQEENTKEVLGHHVLIGISV